MRSKANHEREKVHFGVVGPLGYVGGIARRVNQKVLGCMISFIGLLFIYFIVLVV